MTDHNDVSLTESAPLQPEAQKELDQLCRAYEQNQDRGIDLIIQLTAHVKHVQQNVARLELLTIYCEEERQSNRVINAKEIAKRLSIRPSQVPQNSETPAEPPREPPSAPPQAARNRRDDDPRYVFKKKLGYGGFGRVGLYFDTLFEIDVAIKLPRDPSVTGLTAEILEEARRAKKLSMRHPSVLLSIFDVGFIFDCHDYYCKDDCTHWPADRPAIIMEYAPGGSLKTRLKGPVWHLDVALRKIQSICEGVRVILRDGEVHLDLKPDNILFGHDDNPLITDLGLARTWLDAEPQHIGGTRIWMAPEVLAAWESRNKIRPAEIHDLWGLAAIIFNILTGSPPFQKRQDVQTASFPRVSSLNQTLPGDVQRFFETCFRRDPSDRYSTVDALERALLQALGQPAAWPSERRTKSQKTGLGFRSMTFRFCRQCGSPGLQLVRVHAELTDGSPPFSVALADAPPDLPAADMEVKAKDSGRLIALCAIAACLNVLGARLDKKSERTRQMLEALQQDFHLPSLKLTNTPTLFRKLLGQPAGSKTSVFPFVTTEFTTLDPSAFRHGLSLLPGGSFRFVVDTLDGDAELLSEELLEFLQTDIGVHWDEFSQSPHYPDHDRVPLSELGPFLDEYVRTIALKNEDIAEKLADPQRATATRGQWLPRDVQLGRPESSLAWLTERFFSGKVSELISIKRLKWLLDAFEEPEARRDIPLLMAEWLQAHSRHTNGIRLNLPRQEPRDSECGQDSSYTSASERLDGMECAVVRLELAGNVSPPISPVSGVPVDSLTRLLENQSAASNCQQIPHTNLHMHPGDEIIFVIRGTLCVELQNTGVWTPVSAGDFIHYNAEIPHAAWNVDREPAVAIVIRFFQLSRHSTRRQQMELLSQLEKLVLKQTPEYFKHPEWLARDEQTKSLFERVTFILKEIADKDISRLVGDAQYVYARWSRLAAWIHDRTRPPLDRLRKLDDTSTIHDFVGLSRFVQSYVMQEFPEGTSPETLDQEAQQQQFREIRQLLQQMHATRQVDAPANAEVTPAEQLAEAERKDFKTVSRLNTALTQFCRSYFSNAHWREGLCCFDGVPIDDLQIGSAVLDDLAKLLDVPRILLDGFCAPAAQRMIVVRGAMTDFTGPSKLTAGSSPPASEMLPADWIRPRGNPNGPTAHDIQYFLPVRTLANSDISVTLIDLDARGHSSWNRHPGFEAVIPLRGVISIEFQTPKEGHVGKIPEGVSINDWTERLSQDGDTDVPLTVFVYHSSYMHRVVNDSEGHSARAMIMRFNVVTDP